MIAYQEGRLETAATMIRQAIALHSSGISYYANLGTVLQAQGKLEEAERLYRQVLTLKPDLAEVHVTLATFYKPVENLAAVLRATSGPWPSGQRVPKPTTIWATPDNSEARSIWPYPATSGRYLLSPITLRPITTWVRRAETRTGSRNPLPIIKRR